MHQGIVELGQGDSVEVTSERLAASHLPYAAWREATPRFRVAAQDRILRGLLDQGARVWRSGSAKAPRGLAALAPLPHETRCFGMVCGRLVLLDAWCVEKRADELRALLETALRSAQEQGMAVLWIQTRAIDYELQHLLVEHEFRFADALVDWVAAIDELSSGQEAPCHFEAGPVPDEVEELGQLAAETMEFNRFRAEGRFDTARVSELYRELGRSCARGELGDALWVARDEGGRPLGFVCTEWAARREEGAPHEAGFFRFLARAKDAPPGVGPALLDAGCHGLFELGAERLLAQTVVQNTGMLRSALAKGFRVVDTRYDWFRWMS